MAIKMKKLNIRKLVIGAVPCIHCALIFAPLYITVLKVIYGGESTKYFAGGFFLAVPVAAIFLSSKFSKYMWQYLLSAVLVVTATWVVYTNWVPVAFIAFLAFIKMTGRVAHNDTAFDRPYLPAAIVFLVPAIYSGVATDPPLQMLSVLMAFVYIVMTLVYDGLIRLDNYIDINKDINDFPGRRVSRSGGAVFGIGAALVLAAAVPVILFNFEFIPINIKLDAPRVDPTAQITESVEPIIEEDDWRKEIDDGSTPPEYMAFLDDIAYAAALVLVAGFIIFVVYWASRNFRKTVSEKNDTIESTVSGGEAVSSRKKPERLRLLDFSPNAFVRRKYMKTIKKAKKTTPDQWLAPDEIESFAGVEDSTLHSIYEKARYSSEGCTAEDKNRLQ